VRLYLKHEHVLSDEELVDRWLENIYWQVLIWLYAHARQTGACNGKGRSSSAD